MKQAVKSWILPAVVSLAAVAFLVPPVAAQACVAPNGTDDTATLQAALDRCSGANRHCVVRLCEGLFRAAPLRVGDFRGTLRGAGRERTVIQALPNLLVNDNPLGYWQDDPLDETLPPWPYLLQFIGGRGTVRDLGIRIPSPEEGLRPTQGWTELFGVDYELAGALLVTGRDPARFEVTRIDVVAGEDLESFFETTLFAGVAVRGLLLDLEPEYPSDFPVHPVKGRYQISDSTLVGMLTGVALGELEDADVAVHRNDTSAFVGVDLLDANRSRVRVSRNSWGVDALAFNAFLNLDGAPSEDNTVLIDNNRGAIGSYFGDGGGLYFQDLGPRSEPGNSTVRVFGNDLEVGSVVEPAFSGIEIIGAGSLLVARNVLRGGVGDAGITVDQTTGCRVLFNGLDALDTGAGADLHLWPDTSECLAVVGRDDVVLDEGTGNRVFRLWW